ncbi:MAG: dihydroorotate dehydrogenase electron transfer subunit [Chloroflexota bacterium]
MGSGTRWLAERVEGDELDILGPLGNGFRVDSSARHVLLLAGGIGFAPLLFLALELARNRSVTFVYGAGTGEDLCRFPQMPPDITLLSCTEDGSLGEKGLVTSLAPRFVKSADQLFACGPVNMYRSLACEGHRAAGPGCLEPLSEPDRRKLWRCQVSLEVRMGCGVGACYACSVLTTRGSRKVCLDGPVFELGEVAWDSVRL